MVLVAVLCDGGCAECSMAGRGGRVDVIRIRIITMRCIVGGVAVLHGVTCMDRHGWGCFGLVHPHSRVRHWDRL